MRPSTAALQVVLAIVRQKPPAVMAAIAGGKICPALDIIRSLATHNPLRAYLPSAPHRHPGSGLPSAFPFAPPSGSPLHQHDGETN